MVGVSWCFCFEQNAFLTITSAALSELLNLEGLRLPKNAAKAAKIRKLMESAAVVANTDQIFRDRMEAQLLHQEQKKSKRKAETADEQDEEGDAEQDGLINQCFRTPPTRTRNHLFLFCFVS